MAVPWGDIADPSRVAGQVLTRAGTSQCDAGIPRLPFPPPCEGAAGECPGQSQYKPAAWGRVLWKGRVAAGAPSCLPKGADRGVRTGKQGKPAGFVTQHALQARRFSQGRCGWWHGPRAMPAPCLGHSRLLPSSSSAPETPAVFQTFPGRMAPSLTFHG